MNTYKYISTVKRLSGMFLLLWGIFSADMAHAARFVFTFQDDANATFAKNGFLVANSLFQRNFQAAGDRWGALIDSNQTIHVLVKPDFSVPRFVGGPASSGSSTFSGGVWIYKSPALVQSLAGVDAANTQDMVISVNVSFMLQHYWIDTAPELRTNTQPPNKTDLVSIVLHEIGHGLGIDSFRSFKASHYGLYDDISRSVYDMNTVFLGNGLPTAPNGLPNPFVFTGPEATMVNDKQPLPLSNFPSTDPSSDENWSHIGDCNSSAALRQTVMHGCYMLFDDRLVVTKYDLAIVADLGYPIRSIYFPDSQELLTAIPNPSAANGVLAVRLKLIDANALIFELVDTTSSHRAGAVATYTATKLTMQRLVINDSTTSYFVTMLPLAGLSPQGRARWQVSTMTPITTAN